MNRELDFLIEIRAMASEATVELVKERVINNTDRWLPPVNKADRDWKISRHWPLYRRTQSAHTTGER